MNETQRRFLKFVEDNSDLALTTSVLDCQIAIRRLLNDLAAAREEIARKDEAQGHLARLCSERLDKILELERQLVNEKTAHAWTEVREQSAIDAARAGGTR